MRSEFSGATTGQREVRHRRVVLVVTGVLTLVATSPVIVHHLSTRIGDLLAGRDHVWIVCLIALHELLAPLHTVFHVLLAVGVVFAIVDRARAWQRARHTLGLLRSRPVTTADPLWSVATTVGVPREILHLVEALPNPAFTTGWLRPQIYVDARLQSALSSVQLGAVISHEFVHVRRHDPARLTLLRALGCLLFWIPALRRLAEDVADGAEIAADDFAARGDPVALASAILSLANWRFDASSHTTHLDAGQGVVGFQRDALLERRIHRLLGDEASIVTHVTRRSMLSAFAGLALAWSSGLAVAHPMTAGSVHCTHHHAWAFEHLLCMKGHDRATEPLCPHALQANR